MEEKRKQDMDCTQKKVFEELKTFSKYLIQGSVKTITLDILDKKLQKVSVRSYFIQKIYEYVIDDTPIKNASKFQIDAQQTQKLFFRQLPLIMEVCIAVQYYDNQILDSKNGINQGVPPTNPLIGGDLLERALFRYIRNELPKEVGPIVLDYLEKILDCVAVGQHIDKHCNNYHSFCNGIPKNYQIDERIADFIDLSPIQGVLSTIKQEVSNKDEFIEWYFKRIYLTSNTMFILGSKLVMELVDYQGKEQQNILHCVNLYGFILQLINDYSDFIPISPKISNRPIGKDAKRDLLSDLKNKNITLPLIYHLSRKKTQLGKSAILQFLQTGNKYLLLNAEKIILQELQKNQSLLKTLSHVETLTKTTKSYLNSENIQYFYLKDLVNIGNSNKFKTSFHCGEGLK